MAFLQSAKQAFLNPEFGWKTTHFWGPVANWGIVLSAVYDANTKTPDTISPVTTKILLAYSLVFTRFALKVKPANYLLFACHTFNVAAQSFQLYRRETWQRAETEKALQLPQGPERDARFAKIGPDLQLNQLAMAVAASVGGAIFGTKALKPLIEKYGPASGTLGAKIKDGLLHPAGPFFVHFWAPIFKWSLSISNIVEWDRDLNLISLPQQTALALTGFIWSRYSLVITPRNYSLFLVNFVLGVTGLWHIGRKVKAEYIDEKPKQINNV